MAAQLLMALKLWLVIEVTLTLSINGKNKKFFLPDLLDKYSVLHSASQCNMLASTLTAMTN